MILPYDNKYVDRSTSWSPKVKISVKSALNLYSLVSTKTSFKFKQTSSFQLQVCLRFNSRFTSDFNFFPCVFFAYFRWKGVRGATPPFQLLWTKVDEMNCALFNEHEWIFHTYINIVCTTKGFLKVALERWPEWYTYAHRIPFGRSNRMGYIKSWDQPTPRANFAQLLQFTTEPRPSNSAQMLWRAGLSGHALNSHSDPIL